MIGLSQILQLVGKLDDSGGEDSPRERFRRFLADNVKDVGVLRDYIEECLRVSGPQYDKAFQDLVNHVGRVMGFKVSFGRYRGSVKEIGFDGHWESPEKFHIVVEVKKTDAYAIETSTLVGYIDRLISRQVIPSWDDAMGLYVFGNLSSKASGLEASIVKERRTQQLRIATVDSLLTLAELMDSGQLEHKDLMGILKPSSPLLDKVVEVLARLSATVREPQLENESAKQAESAGRLHWLIPVSGDETESSVEKVNRLVVQNKMFALSKRAPHLKDMKEGDFVCFYATKTGVVAHAVIKSGPTYSPDSRVNDSERFPWVIELRDVEAYLSSPVVLNAELRAELNAFIGRSETAGWSWFVQTVRKISSKDFARLTGTEPA